MTANIDQKIVYLQEIAAPVGAALRQHLSARPDILLTDTPAALPPHLVICAETADNLPPAVPILRLMPPDRLGSLLADIYRALDEPALAVTPFHIGENLFIPAEKTLQTPSGDDIPLTERETALLLHLARHAPGAVARDALLRAVWGYQDGIDTHTLETHIYRLRQKIAGIGDGQVLKTEAQGYVLADVRAAREHTA